MYSEELNVQEDTKSTNNVEIFLHIVSCQLI